MKISEEARKFLDKPLEIWETKTTKVLQPRRELECAMKQNPDLPVVYLVYGENFDFDNLPSQYATDVRVSVGEVLDCRVNIDGIDLEETFTDRNWFFEKVEDMLYGMDEFKGLEDYELDEVTERFVKKYDPFWVRCLIVELDN